MQNDLLSSFITNPERLTALDGYGILDTAPEEGFDDIVRLATRLCEAPVALVSLVAADRQWFKARVGFPHCETDLDRSVCKFALAEPDLLIVPDLTVDPRTAANPLVTGESGIRFYAGAPLRMSNGTVLGSLCVIDTVPRPDGLTSEQADDLRALGRQVSKLMELRRTAASDSRGQKSALPEAERLKRAVAAHQASEAHWRGLFERLNEGFIVGEVIRDTAGMIRDWRYIDVNAAWGDLVSIDPATVAGRTIREVFPGIEDAWVNEFADVVETGEAVAFTRQVGTLARWYEGRAFPIGGERFGVIFLEVTDRVQAEARRNALLRLGDRLRDVDTRSAMTAAAAEIVGRTLSATRACYGHVEGEVEFVMIEPDWLVPGQVSIAGRHRFDDFGDLRAHLGRGEALVVNDVTTDPRTRRDPGPLQAIGVRSLVNMPVCDRGRTVAVFIVHDDKPRVWTSEELVFLRNVTDRVEVGVGRVRAEEQQAILNGELSHRLKNTLAMVQGIAGQTLRSVPDQVPIRAFSERLIALARAHDVLMQDSWVAAPIRSVVEKVLPLQVSLDRFRIDGPNLGLSPQATLSLSLLLHELTTNAVKYGALSTDEGVVRLGWRIEADAEAEQAIVLSWQERGGPAAVAPTRKGFGARLIQSGLVGTRDTRLSYEAAGLDAEFRAPISQVVAS